MNIAILISDITRTGGTERAVVTLANMISKNGANVTIISLTKKESESCFYSLLPQVNIVFLNNKKLSKNIFKKIFWSISTIFLLRKFNKFNKFDFFLSTGHNLTWLIPFTNTNNKTKIVACEHIVYESIPRSSRFFMTLSYRYINHIVVLSEKAKESFGRYSNVSVIPNAVSFESHTQSLLTNPEIILVGRLSAVKGLERLVPIAKSIKSKYPFWKISLVGDGEIREELELLFKKSNLEGYIDFRGVVKDVSKVYLDASIYAMTSHFEAFPMVLLEAQRCGLPVVAFDCPEGPSQILHNGEDGFLIQNGDSDAFAKQLMVLMDNYELRKQFGNQAYLNSMSYSEKNILNKWNILFNK